MPIDLATDPLFTAGSPGMAEIVRRGYFGFTAAETWTPNVNLYEMASRYLVCVDLAGVEKDKIDLTVVDGRLRLRGSRPVPAFPADVEPAGGAEKSQDRRARLHLMEIDHGAFTREVDLPEDIRQADIVATYRNGMLWIEIPKTK